MNRIILKLAACVVEVREVLDSTVKYCADYLHEGTPDFSVTLVPSDYEMERRKAIREAELEGKMPNAVSDAQLEITALQRKIAEEMFDYDTLVFHGSAVSVDGEAYLFTAKSGTGKSTHTALWRQIFGERAVMVNDDKPFLRIGETEATVYGSPWNGKHGLSANIGVPLKGICILERGMENTIREIPAGEGLLMLLQQSNRPMEKSKMPAYMELLDKLSRQVRFYRMNCNMDPEAARMSYTAMSGKNLEN